MERQTITINNFGFRCEVVTEIDEKGNLAIAIVDAMKKARLNVAYVHLLPWEGTS